MDTITRTDVLNHFETAITAIRQFRESWRGRFSRSILGSFKDLEYNIDQELQMIDYLTVHPSSSFTNDDWALFDKLTLIIDEDLEQLRHQRIKPAVITLTNQYNNF